jgi:catechol 2,3-dioxygenase-like lactoylglutathione lyase family enzyme
VITGWMHVNVNCSDLERSRRFYEDGLGLHGLTHTAPAPQDGTGFGIDGPAAWDAWICYDHRGPGRAVALDLLQWLQPEPVGTAPGPGDLGITRLVVAVRDLDATRDRLAAHGPPVVASDELGWARDPDGTRIELVGDPELSGPVELREIVVGCTDLAASVAWYGRLVGMVEVGRDEQPGRSTAVLALAAAPGCRLRLEQWVDRPAARPRPVANQLGPFRTAWLTDDAAADHAAWAALGVELTGPPVWLDMGPDVPVDGLWAVFGFDPDGACVELIQSPEVRRR